MKQVMVLDYSCSGVLVDCFFPVKGLGLSDRELDLQSNVGSRREVWRLMRKPCHFDTRQHESASC